MACAFNKEFDDLHGAATRSASHRALIPAEAMQ
jgi:hypothetical protein